MWKTVVISSASVVLTLLVIVGVAWAADIFAVDRNGALYLRITADGSMGIGNPAPDPGSQLVVRGSGTTSATSAMNVTASDGTSRFFVRDDGNVGVGTTVPGAKLDVSGSVIAETLSGSWDNSSNGYIRLGNMQIVWGSVTFTPGAGTPYTDVAFTFPGGVSFIDTGYRITATMIDNYGNAFGHVAFAYPSSTTQGLIRFKNTYNSANTALATGANYTAIGRWQ